MTRDTNIRPLLWAALGGLTLASVAGAQVTANVVFGDAASEKAHNVSVTSAELVRDAYPQRWVMSVRASAFQDDHEPHRAIDGDDQTHWQVAGRPPAPMARGNWIELDLNESMTVESVQVRWTGDRPYSFKIYDKPFSDLRRLRLEGRSAEKPGALETYALPEPTRTRAVRVEFAVDPENRPQGIAEIRIGGVAWPDGYPPAKYPGAAVEVVHRPYYVEFERFLKWPVFNLKRPLADGQVGRRLLPLDTFEGGRLDFDLAVDPARTNFVTLKLWESNTALMTAGGPCIVIEPLVDDPVGRGRGCLPAFMTEEQHTQQEWYGVRPTPGRWVFATYRLPPEVTKARGQIRLRLQGVGNVRRDAPMRSPPPPLYSASSHTGFLGAGPVAGD